MSDFYYTIQFEKDGGVISCQTPKDVFDLLKKKKLLSVLRYNDTKTGAEFAKHASFQDLTTEEQEQRPVCIKTTLSEEAVFVPTEEFWVENYMLDEFYNPDKMPYIVKMIKSDSEYCY